MSEFELSWMDAIKKVLREAGAMSCENITSTIISNKYRRNYGSTPKNTVNLYLNTGLKTGVFKRNERGEWELIDTSMTVGKSATTKVALDVLVLACIKTIGRKCFDVKELYAFAPIFKVCVPECEDLENVLKQQLDELVKKGILDALPSDYYHMK